MNTKELIEEMNAYYCRRAPWHDDYMNYTSNAAMEKLLAPVIALFAHRLPGCTVLEIGCGTGNWTQVLAKRASAVTATDVSAEAVAIAGKKTEALQNISYEVIDAYDIDSLDGRFDIVFAADFFSHVPVSMINPFLETVHRKLKPGGRVIFLDILFIEELDVEGFFFDDEGNRINPRTLPDGSRFRVVKNYPDENRFGQILDGITPHFDYYEIKELKRWVVTWVKE